MHVPVVGEVLIDLWVLSGCLKYALNAEILVLRYVHDFDVVAFDATGGLV